MSFHIFCFVEHQLSQLEKQLITCNVNVTKFEKIVVDMKEEFVQREKSAEEMDVKLNDSLEKNKKLTEEIVSFSFFLSFFIYLFTYLFTLLLFILKCLPLSSHWMITTIHYDTHFYISLMLKIYV